MNDGDLIKSQAAEIERMQETERLMDVFIAAGIDNWEGYDEAVATFDAAAKSDEQMP